MVTGLKYGSDQPCGKAADDEPVAGFVMAGSECTKDFLLQEIERLRAENAELKDRLGEVSDPECRRWEVSYSYITPDSSARNVDSVCLYAYSADMAKKFFVNQVAVMSSVVKHAIRWPKYDLKIFNAKEVEK